KSFNVPVGLHAGFHVPKPTGPISVLMFAGVSNAWTLMCGNNLPVPPASCGHGCSGNFYHPLTVDDEIAYWEGADGITSATRKFWDQNGSTTSLTTFCRVPAVYGAQGNGLGTTLEKQIDTKGTAGTEIMVVKLLGSGTAVPMCSFDYQGNDTLACTTG